MSESTKQMKTDHGDDRSNDHSNTKSFIAPNPSLFPYSFMSWLVIAYLDDQDVILSLLLVNKAMKLSLTGYRLKAPIKQKIALELNCRPDRYLNINPTQLNDVHDLASFSCFTSITSIQLSDSYSDDILPGTFPHSITELHLGSTFSQPITRNMLPAQLKKLTLSTDFDYVIAPDVLPDSLEHLDLGFDFNQPLVPGSLPPSLLFLSLGVRFDHPLQLDVLPLKLITLRLSSYFNRKLSPGVLPASLLDLHLGCEFNQRLKPGDLPSSITHLHMGRDFDHKLPPGVLPPSLIKLELSRFYNKPLVPGCLPNTLHSLVLGDESSHPIAPGVLPLGLKCLSLSTEFDKSIDGMPLPELFKLNRYSQGRVIFSKDTNDLTHSHSPGKLSITAMTIGGKLVQPGSIPSSVTRLRLCSAIAPGVIPNSVTHLVWDTEDALDVGVVPSSVTHITFDDYFNTPIPSLAIPSSVTHLSFGQHFTQQITPSFIPDTVQYVDLFRCRSANHDVILPASVYCVAIRNRSKLVTRPPCVVLHSLESMMCGPLDIPDSFLEL